MTSSFFLRDIYNFFNEGGMNYEEKNNRCKQRG